MQFLLDYRVNFAWRRSKSEAWLKFGHVTRNFALYSKLLMRPFLKNRKKSRLKNKDTERTWTSNTLLESIVIPALCNLIWFGFPQKISAHSNQPFGWPEGTYIRMSCFIIYKTSKAEIKSSAFLSLYIKSYRSSLQS